jgi:hypothetical protein
VNYVVAALQDRCVIDRNATLFAHSFCVVSFVEGDVVPRLHKGRGEDDAVR